jgi:hypothetical protein
MDRDRHSQRTAMRLRAEEAMRSALSAADQDAPSLAVFLEDTMTSIKLVCEDSALEPRRRLALIDDALLLLGSLKSLLRTDTAASPALIMEVGRRTSGLLCRYSRFIRDDADQPR